MAGKGVELQARTMDDAVRAVRLYQHFQKQRDSAAIVIAKQFMRSATSIGANLLEAQAGESRRDFIHKCSIAQKEAREANYWLMLMLNSGLATEGQLKPLIRETDELIAIITTIIVRSKRKT